MCVGIRGVGPVVIEVLEGVAVLERKIEVEEHEPVSAVLLATVCLHVVVRPVVGAEVELYGHVVGELIDVEELLQLVISSLVVDSCAQAEYLVEHLAVAHLELEVLEHIDEVVIIAVVCLYELLVVHLPEVEHASELSVDILDDGLIALEVEVDARPLHDGL